MQLWRFTTPRRTSTTRRSDQAHLKTIIVAHHKEIVRHGLQFALERAESLELIGQAEDVPALLALLEQRQPDVLVLGRLKGTTSVEAAAAIHARFPSLAMLVRGWKATSLDLERLAGVGVRGYRPSDANQTDIVAAVRIVSEGGTAFAFRVAERETAWLRPLTRRERQIADLLRQAMNNKRMARELGIAEATLEGHLRNL